MHLAATGHAQWLRVLLQIRLGSTQTGNEYAVWALLHRGHHRSLETNRPWSQPERLIAQRSSVNVVVRDGRVSVCKHRRGH